MRDRTMFGGNSDSPRRHARRIANSESRQVLREKLASEEFRGANKPPNK